jgi:hypothetical protein
VVAMTDKLEDRLGRFLLMANAPGSNAALSSPATLYVGLYSADPGDGETGGTEQVGENYTRQSIAFEATGTNGVFQNASSVAFPPATGDGWGTIGGIGIFDAASAGNMLFHGALVASKVIGAGDVFTLPAGNVTITFN